MDRIAQGENAEDDSWLGQVYQQFKHLMKDEDGSEPEGYNVEGLEPPMFDDTWGLADDFNVMVKNGKSSFCVGVQHHNVLIRCHMDFEINAV